MSEWVSAKDKLPDREGRYVVVTQSRLTGTSGLTRTPALALWTNEHWCLPSEWTVTHWLPLPDMPKEENNAET